MPTHTHSMPSTADYEKSSAPIAEWDKAVGDMVNKRLDEALRAPLPASKVFADEMAETTQISRVALEGLVTRAGFTMDWNKGNPVFYEKGERLGNISNDGKTTKMTMEDAKAIERRERARATGASQADIEAADKILAGAPMSPPSDPFFIVHPSALATDAMRGVTDEAIRKELADGFAKWEEEWIKGGVDVRLNPRLILDS